eukprot:8023091-Pyramimonas_sp.AAC.1
MASVRSTEVGGAIVAESAIGVDSEIEVHQWGGTAVTGFRPAGGDGEPEHDSGTCDLTPSDTSP